MEIAYFYLTKQGEELVQKISSQKPGDIFGKENFKENMKAAFTSYDALICVMATGIVVRTLAPLLVHKTKDPAVLVLDQNGNYVISLLSGHIGGANELAKEIAKCTKGEAVLTTATDVSGKLAFDVFAKKNQLGIENIEMLKWISGALVDGKRVDVIANEPIPYIFDEQIKKVEHPGNYPLVVIDETLYVDTNKPVLYLRPKNISIGVGCTKNREAKAISEALKIVLREEKIHPCRVANIATIPLKSKEEGIIALAREYNVPLKIIPKEKIEGLDFDNLNINQSAFVKTTTGLPSVSTACAYLAAYKGKIIRDKAKFKGITIAVAKKENKIYSAISDNSFR